MDTQDTTVKPINQKEQKMGTLFEQKPRNYHRIEPTNVLEFVRDLKRISREEGITFDQAVSVYECLQEDRRSNIQVDDLDTKDEQLGGFGLLIREAIDKIPD